MNDVVKEIECLNTKIKTLIEEKTKLEVEAKINIISSLEWEFTTDFGAHIFETNSPSNINLTLSEINGITLRNRVVDTITIPVDLRRLKYIIETLKLKNIKIHKCINIDKIISDCEIQIDGLKLLKSIAQKMEKGNNE